MAALPTQEKKSELKREKKKWQSETNGEYIYAVIELLYVLCWHDGLFNVNVLCNEKKQIHDKTYR